MASFASRVLQFGRHPVTQFVRHRSKVNIQRPRAPHHERALILHITKPMFVKKPVLPMHELCLKPAETKKNAIPDDPYRRFLAKSYLDLLNKSTTIIFFQQNSIKMADFFKVRVLFKRKNMVMYTCSSNIAKLALLGTKYEAVLPLYGEPTTPIVAACGTDVDLGTVFKITKKVPQIIMLGGIVDNQLLSKSELQECSLLGDLRSVQAQLVAVLNSVGTQLEQNLTYHQRTLVGHLDKHLEIQTLKDQEQQNT